MKRLISRCLAFGLGLVFCLGGSVWGQRNEFERSPIDYLTAPVNDPVARLNDRLARGDLTLTPDNRLGYLPAVLEALDVPASSQTLVFSKTSLQLQRISPRTPRALYFNDEVYVGFCQNGDLLELAATDPKQGAIFYTLDQSAAGTPRFVRDDGSCLSCHATSRTLDVPGYVVRSVFADASGRPRSGSRSFTTNHTSDFQDRWGGWYVTGTHGSMRHLGNTISTGMDHSFDRDRGANRTDLQGLFPTDPYLTPHSDLVALMVLEHQAQMHNAITAAGFETRQAVYQSQQMNEILERPPGHLSESAQRRIAKSADLVLRTLLMCDEFALTSPVEGSTEFAAEFSGRGVRDSQGRSLRDFDLQTRLFHYPCSYLIHSDAFRSLPSEVLSPILDRLRAILDGTDESPEYAHLTPELRRDISAILIETLPEFRLFPLAQN